MLRVTADITSDQLIRLLRRPTVPSWTRWRYKNFRQIFMGRRAGQLAPCPLRNCTILKPKVGVGSPWSFFPIHGTGKSVKFFHALLDGETHSFLLKKPAPALNFWYGVEFTPWNLKLWYDISCTFNTFAPPPPRWLIYSGVDNSEFTGKRGCGEGRLTQ